MNNPYAWYLRSPVTGEPKTHARRSCPSCLANPGTGCMLPFRRQKLRWIKGIRLLMMADRVWERRQRTWSGNHR